MTGCIKCSDSNVYAHGMCQRCYNRRRYENNRGAMLAASNRYYHDNTDTRREYYRIRHQRTYVPTGGENRDCGVFLGVHVAERVLSKVFKGVERMPYHNRGFDFICSRGKKIDVKSATYSTRNGSVRWQFYIRKNTIADFFLCIAFDNRDELTPLHMWLLPGDVVNDKSKASITNTALDKWDEYRIPIDKTVECCNEMKQGGLKQDD